MRAVILVVIGRLLAAIVCAVVGGVLAYEGKDGWGWFLFAAVWLGAIGASSSPDEKPAEVKP